jgi:hypothetical protein
MCKYFISYKFIYQKQQIIIVYTDRQIIPIYISVYIYLLSVRPSVCPTLSKEQDLLTRDRTRISDYRLQQSNTPPLYQRVFHTWVTKVLCNLVTNNTARYGKF